MKGEGLSFAARLSAWFALVVIGLSVALFLAAYFLLYRAVQEQDRVVVRAQLEVYRAWYAEGGLPALNTRFREHGDRRKELFFVRVIGPQRTALFIPFASGKMPERHHRLEAFATAVFRQPG